MQSNQSNNKKTSCYASNDSTLRDDALAHGLIPDVKRPHDTPCLFFELLPREIRDEIYRHALRNLCAAFMHGKAQIRVVYHCYKGFIKDTYKEQIPWMSSNTQMYQEATEQFYHLARFNMDLDLRYRLHYIKDVIRPAKIRYAPTLTRARFLSVVNLTIGNLRQTEGLVKTVYFDAEIEQCKALVELFPHMIALRKLEINMKLKVPTCNEHGDAEYKPSLSFLQGLSRGTLATLRIELEYSHRTYGCHYSTGKRAVDHVVSRLSDPLKKEIARYALHAIRGDNHQWKEWKEEVGQNVDCHHPGFFTHQFLGFEITATRYRLVSCLESR